MAQSTLGKVEVSFADSDKGYRQGCFAFKIPGNSRCPLMPFYLLGKERPKGADHRLRPGSELRVLETVA